MYLYHPLFLNCQWLQHRRGLEIDINRKKINKPHLLWSGSFFNVPLFLSVRMPSIHITKQLIRARRKDKVVMNKQSPLLNIKAIFF